MVFSAYRVSSEYGSRIHPISKKRSFHAGIDLVKGHNTPIYSFTSGKVIYARFGASGSGLGGYGNVVMIRTNDGTGHVYAHLNTIRVKVNQNVKKGTILGNQGATGNVTGSHLHYEIRRNTTGSYGWTNKPSSSTMNPHTYHKNSSGGGRVVVKLKVDGVEGKATIKREQQFLGVSRDGIRGKNTIKEWQLFLNRYGQISKKLSVDGIEGRATVRVTQRFLGAKQDGIKGIDTIGRKQTFLNRYGQ